MNAIKCSQCCILSTKSCYLYYQYRAKDTCFFNHLENKYLSFLEKLTINPNVEILPQLRARLLN